MEQTAPQPMPDPLLVLRPKFIPDLLRLETALYSFFAIFGLTVAGGVILMLLFLMLGLGNFFPVWLGFFAVMVAGLVLVPSYVQTTLKKNLAQTICKFYTDHLVYQTFQWVVFKRRGRIRYADILDISERSNVFKSRYNIGDLWILAPGVTNDSGQNFPGVKINNVEFSESLSDFFENTLFNRMPQQQTAQNA